MVNISIDVTDLGGEARAGDKVTLWSPRVAGSAFRAGGVVSTAPVTVFLTNGKATVPNVEPGDMRVLLQCRGVESQGPIDVVVPDGTGTVTLRSLIESQFEYSPPIVSAVQQAADNAAASERAAIQAQVRSEAAADRAEARVDEAINNGAELVRAEVKQDADRAVAAKNGAQAAQSAAELARDDAQSAASSTVADIHAELDGLVATADGHASRAEAAATTAAGETSALVRSEFEGMLSGAESARDAAGVSETNAAQSEADAAGYADLAEQYKTAAELARDDAAQSKADAAQSASSADDDAGAAAASATSAAQSESSAATHAQNASDAAYRVGTAEQVGTWAQQAQDAADRIGTAEQVGRWADDARSSASSANSSESKAKEYRDAAATAASTTVDSVRSELRGVVSEASGYATESSRSAARAKTSETNAKTSETNASTHAANSFSAAERAEFAAEETIQQVEGDFATRNYVDGKVSPSEIPAGTDWNTLTETGGYNRRYNSSNDINAPSEAAGFLYVGDVRHPQKTVTTHLFVGYAGDGVFYRSTGGTGQWTAWARIDVDDRIDDADTMMVGDARRAAVVQAGIARRGVSIGTGGLGAIALRFDHHLDSFGTKVLPLLKKYRLPWGQMLNYRGIGRGDDNWSWSKISTECHNSGGEVWNHSWSHSDVATKEQARREVALGLSELKTNLPSLWIDSFAPPGQPNMDGFEGQDTPEKFWGSHYGRMILATHAFSRGYWPGSYQPLHAPNLIGAPHATIDKQSVAWVKGYVAGAMRSKTGATIMLHPNYLDTTGYMTTAQLDEVLAYIADLRDTGQIQVLSCSGILVGDRELAVNHTNHLENAEAGSITSSQTWTVSERVGRDNFGVTHEATAWVRATASGTLTLTVTVDSPTNPVSQTHTVTATAGQVVRLGVVVTPPMDTTAQTVRLVGNVTHTGVNYRPI